MSLNVLDRLKAGEQALVPAFWAAGRITPEQAQSFFDALRVLNPRFDYVSMEQVAGPIQAMCRNHRLTPHDALYVELALRSGCTLATLDHPQREAAEALGVPCL